MLESQHLFPLFVVGRFLISAPVGIKIWAMVDEVGCGVKPYKELVVDLVDRYVSLDIERLCARSH